MEKDKQPTKMIFRKYRDTGEIIALLPYEIADQNGHVGSYMHLGQHGAADLHYVMQRTAPATEQEHAPLLAELEENFGYMVQPVKRINKKLHYRARMNAR
jgi:hypothetical protein